MTQAVIFDIQRFSIHDGPGIRTTLFLKGCPLRCAWCQNPESHKIIPEIAFYAHRCLDCLECQKHCRQQAILDNAIDNADGHAEPLQRVDDSRCIGCGNCASICSGNALKLMGVNRQPKELLEEILKDRDFFQDSGGGITLSGGEPGMQTEFLYAFLPLVKAEGIHVNMETCGMFHWRGMEKILPLLDLVYFDLKIMDPSLHKKYTGRANRDILENFSRLNNAFTSLQARMPVIPTITDSPENIEAIAQLLNQQGKSSIHLLKYHRMGESKLTAITTNLKPLNLEGDPDCHAAAAAELFGRHGIAATVYE